LTTYAQAGACALLASGGCVLNFDQSISAPIGDPNRPQEWQLVADGSGQVDIELAGLQDPSADVYILRGDRSLAADPVKPNADGTASVSASVEQGFYQVQVVPHATTSAPDSTYNLVASFSPNPSAPPPPPPPVCSAPMAGGFGRLYASDASIRQRIGCPLAAEAGLPLSEQAFQWGHMTWRSDRRQIVVNYGDGRSATFPDTYVDGEPEVPRVPPSPTLVTPTRGFGKVWRTHPDLVTSLGWALGPERGFGGAIQDFQNGLMIWTGEDQLMVRVVYTDGNWLLIPDPARTS
jgi:hypothetical protein